MRRWLRITLVLILVAGAAYLYLHRQLFDLSFFHRDAPAPPSAESAPAPVVTTPPAQTWQVLEPAQQGFRVELPGPPQDAHATAFDDHGRVEPVQMIESQSDGPIQYVLCWSDNPPVVRAARSQPDATLNSARDGMLTRTHSSLDDEVRINVGGFPAREISAHNAQGGVLNARLILAGNRLYMLMALFPSAAERREADVLRFFQSFQLTRPAETATAQGGN